MSAKILLVDDDEMLLAGLKRQLRNKFRVETAVSGETADSLGVLASPNSTLCRYRHM